MTDPSRAVFLSYASEDAPATQRIAEALRAAGIEVWFDREELRGGDAWDRRIREQIHDCRLFIAVISAHTEARDEGYFRREWKLAVDRTHDMDERKAFLVPVVIDATSERGAHVPEKFRELQWTRLPGGEAPSAFVERVRRLLSPEAPIAEGAAANAPAGFTTAETSRRSVRSPWRSKPALWAIGALLAVALSYYVADNFWLSKRTAPTTTSAAPVSATAPEKSIAVLPFADLSEKHDQEYFAAGIAQEVTDLLAKLPGLRVIGRTSAFQFGGKEEDIRSIGAKLGAAFLVEGSVRRSSNRVRVTAQLIGTGDGVHRWSESYDREIGDVLEVQEAIAANLARALQLTVSSDFGSRGTHSTEAYELYLRGLHGLDQQSQESTDEAAGNFQQALDLDPTFAAAALGLAKVYRAKGEVAWLLPTRVPFERAREAAELALKLDPKLGAAHAVLADVHVIYDWDWTGADLEIKRARDLGDRVEAIQAAARLAAVRGDWDRATVLFQRGLAADPLNANLHLLFAWGVGLRSGRFAEAESLMRRALEISPTIGSGRWFLGLSLLRQNRLDEALKVMQQETTIDGQLEGSAVVYHAMGKRSESDAALKRAIEQNAAEWPSAIARAYAFRGERDEAMKWLERAYSVKDEDLYFIKGDPLVRNLEGDPRYKAFLRKMNLSE